MTIRRTSALSHHPPALRRPGRCRDAAYERRAMHDWLARSNQSPRTGAALPHSLLTPCHHLRVAADEWRESH